MESPEWRSFVSQEMSQLEPDFDLAASPGQDRAANRLLQRNLQDQHSEEPTQATASPRQSYTNGSFVYSDDTEMHPLPSHAANKQLSVQLGAHGNYNSAKGDISMYWKGNAWYDLTWDFLGIVVSLCFLVLGAFVVHLKGQKESTWSIQVIQATRIAPSLWPVLFSGVLGNAIRSLADWRVERGVDLLTLEQLMSSLTLAGSLITIFKWSILRLSSIALLFLWAFNPLGSQSSFRGIYLKDFEGSGAGGITYYNYNLSNQIEISSIGDGSTNVRVRPKLRALYSAALYDMISATQYIDKTNTTYQSIALMLGGEKSAGVQAATDAWGNVRMPNLQTLSDYDSEDPHRWIEVPWMDAIQNYTSLVGDQVDGIRRNFTGNTTFNITSSYQTFSCSPWLGFNESEETEQWMISNFQKNFTEIMDPEERQSIMPRTFFVASSSDLPRTPDLSTAPLGKPQFGLHPDIFFGTLCHTPYMAITRCSARTKYIDAQMSCISKGALGKTNCGVNSVRETLSPTNPAELNILETIPFYSPDLPDERWDWSPNLPNAFMTFFMDLLDDSLGGSGTSSLAEWYLKDPLTALNRPSNFGYANLGDLDIKLFEKRLSLLWNTLWKVGIQYGGIMGGKFRQSDHHDPLLNTTSIITFPLPSVYALDLPWIILYFLSVAIMFFAAVFSLIMHYRCHAPPVLGYVSSLIRDSKYFDDGKILGNSAEDGTGKTKRLQYLKVMIADTKTDEDVGKIAFVPAHAESRVRRRRWYK